MGGILGVLATQICCHNNEKDEHIEQPTVEVQADAFQLVENNEEERAALRDRFSQIKNYRYLIGSGGQADVYKGRFMPAGEQTSLNAAFKFYHNVARAHRELQQISQLLLSPNKLHNNVISVLALYTDLECGIVCLIMERCHHALASEIFAPDYTPLIDVMDERVVQIVDGMIFLHDIDIVHRDLSPNNVLISMDNVCKITDFGVSRTVVHSVSREMSFSGTLAYMAPEAITQTRLSKKVDVWSFGVTLWATLTGRHPYDDAEMAQIVFNVGTGDLRLDVDAIPEAFAVYRNVVSESLRRDPSQRPTFGQLKQNIQHQFNQHQHLSNFDIPNSTNSHTIRNSINSNSYQSSLNISIC